MSELSRETEALIERGRLGTPLPRAHRARLKGVILARVAGGAVVTTATSAAAWTSVAGKIVGAVVLATATSVGIATATDVWGPKPRPTATQAATGGAAAPVAVPARGSVTAPLAVRPSEPAPIAAAVTPTPTPTPRPLATLAAPSTPTPTPTPTSILITPPTSILPPPATSTPTSIPAAPSTLEREANLLFDADAALKSGDSDRALSLLALHASTFPHSVLEPERSAQRVFALCQASRDAEARAEAEKFLRAHPAGPLAVRVGRSCGGSPRYGE